MFFALLFLSGPVSAVDSESCNPFVEASTKPTTVAQLLKQLAEQHRFTLSFPKSLDRPVVVDEAMPLDRVIKYVTTGMNTVLLHEKTTGCDELKLVELSVIPAGEETEYIHVERPVGEQPTNYIYIENMEQYVTEVLLRKRKADIKHMTPEQRIEFRLTKKRLRRELKDEIKKAKREQKQNQKKQARQQASDKT